jgi:hypothetical protein
LFGCYSNGGGSGGGRERSEAEAEERKESFIGIVRPMGFGYTERTLLTSAVPDDPIGPYTRTHLDPFLSPIAARNSKHSVIYR